MNGSPHRQPEDCLTPDALQRQDKCQMARVRPSIPLLTRIQSQLYVAQQE